MQRQKSQWLSKEAAENQREWYIVDLENQVLGRAAYVLIPTGLDALRLGETVQ